MSRAVALLLLALAGCRFGFDALDPGGGDGSTDATDGGDGGDAGLVDAPDPGPQPALCGIPGGEWELTAPEPVKSISDLIIAQFPMGDRSEFDPAFSADGLTLWFTSDQSGAFFVWRATRPSRDEDYDTAALESSDINAAPNLHFGFQPLTDLGRAVISAPYTGELGGGDYWLGDRMAMWTWKRSDLSTTSSDIDARMTASGLELFLVRGDTNAARDIYHATRATIDDDFGAAIPIPELNAPSSDSGPAPVPSNTGLVFVTDRAGSLGGENLWYAERFTGGAFGAPYPLTVLNSPTFDGEPAVFEVPGGGCELVFISDRDGSFDLYRSFVRRL